MTYFRTFRHYHRHQELNGRVRDGNACDLLDMVTGNRTARGQACGTRYTIGFSKRGCSFLGGSADRETRRAAEQKWSSVRPLVPIG